MIHHITRATRILIFWSLIATALGLSLLRFSISGLENYKAELEREIGSLIDAPVEIGRIKAGMRGITPELVLKDINVLGESADRQLEAPVKFKEIRLNINPLDVFRTGRLWGASWLTIVGADLTIQRKTDGSFALAGLQVGGDSDYPLWLLQGRQFELLHSRIVWRDEMRGGKPVRFDRVDLMIKNDGSRHQLHLLTALPERIGHTVRVSMDLNGNFFEPGSLDGKLYFEGSGIDLSDTMFGGSLDGVDVKSGLGDLKLWLAWQKGRLSGVTGDLDLSRLLVKFDDQETLSADQFNTLFRWRDDGRRWQLDIGRLNMENKRGSPTETQLSMSALRNAQDDFESFALSAHRLDLEKAAGLLALPGLLPVEYAQRLKKIKPAGKLENFILFVEPEKRIFAVDGAFTGLGVADLDSMPGFSGLSGRIRGSDERGILQLATRNAELTSVGLFRQPLPIERLSARFDWRKTSDAWVVTGKPIHLDVTGASTVSRMRLSVPANGSSPILDLQSAFSVADLRLVKRYLPVASMDADTVARLDRAFIAGRIPQGGLLFSGSLEDFPFTRRQGVFEVLFDVTGMELNYNPEWPNLTGVDAAVFLYGASLRVDVLKARTLDYLVRQIEINIPSLNENPHLLVKGIAEASISGALEFLRQTPVGLPVDDLSASITPKGNTTVTFDLDIPLDDSAQQKVDGAATLDNASLALHSFDLPVDKIDGSLKFNEQGIYAGKFQAVALGSPIRIKIENEAKGTAIKVAGQTTIDELSNQFKSPWWNLAEGKTDYHLELALHADGNRIPHLTILSDLSGVSLALPESLAKGKDQARPLSLVFALSDERLLPVRMNYDNVLNAAFKIDMAKKTVHSGHVLFGTGAADHPDEPVIKLEANRDRMHLEEWLRFADASGGESVPAHEIKISVRQLINRFMDLGRMELMLTRRDDVWTGRIDSAVAKGNLLIPVDLAGDHSIQLAMNFIDLSVLSDIRLEGDADQPSGTVPLFDVESEKVIWRSVDLGRLELRTTRIPNGLHFQRLTVTDQNENLDLTGRWINDGFRSSTELKGAFKGRQFGRVLNELGLYDSMKETRIAAKLDLNWDAAPYRFSLERLRGQVDVELKDGRLLSIEPGLGRVLGIVAFSQWIKRLQLDFRDVYKEGLSFNTIKGRIHFADGIATTSNLEVDAAPAKIKLSGTANLIDKTLDQQVRVVPKSFDAVPIAGTIVGRLAGLIAEAVANDYQEGFFFGSQYHVKGSWEEPEIVPLHKDDGLFHKTWQGLTDFPWTKKND